MLVHQSDALDNLSGAKVIQVLYEYENCERVVRDSEYPLVAEWVRTGAVISENLIR